MSAGNWKDMLYAIQNGDKETVKYHLKNGVNPNYEHPEFFTTPLIESILHEEIEIVEILLQSGADPKLKSGFNNESPLKLAKKIKNKEILRLLNAYAPANNYSNFYRYFTNVRRFVKK